MDMEFYVFKEKTKFYAENATNLFTHILSYITINVSHIGTTWYNNQFRTHFVEKWMTTMRTASKWYLLEKHLSG